MAKPIGIICLISILFCTCLNKANNSSRSTSDWKHHTTKHFKLHAQTGSRSTHSLPIIGQKLEDIQQLLLARMQESKPLHLDVYFLKDRETLTSYTGFPANGYTDTQKGIIYFADKAPFRLAFHHELMHALSWRLWGTPKGYWLSEGIAVFASGTCGGFNLHALAKSVAEQGKIVPFNTLVDTFDFRSLEPSIQAASLVKYIWDQYGVDVLKRFWQSGLHHANNIIGIPDTQLEKEWKEFIDQYKVEGIINWSNIKKSGCE